MDLGLTGKVAAVAGTSRGLGDAVVRDPAGDGFRVNHRMPGGVRRVIPLGRHDRPGESANAVVFLFSDAARSMTWASRQADGGMLKGVL